MICVVDLEWTRLVDIETSKLIRDDARVAVGRAGRVGSLLCMSKPRLIRRVPGDVGEVQIRHAETYVILDQPLLRNVHVQ